jgi:pantoate--beta-alanine ligase
VETVHTVADLREAVAGARRAGGRIGLVPTMGNLHEGHLALVDAARERCDLLVASIFVNPMQFGPNEDLDAYPRTLDADREGLSAHGTDLVFAPPVAEVYPDGLETQTRVSVPGLSNILCGASRPGHFDGVATVVTKLFNLVQPDVAVFGRKDFQQLTLIRRMVRDLCMPVEIVGVPTSRADDGLALSSRNGYLSEDERARAPALAATLRWVAGELRAGGDPGALEVAGAERLEAAGLRCDYLAVRRVADLQPPAPGDDDLVVLGAAFCGRTRLIDNLVVAEAAA